MDTSQDENADATEYVDIMLAEARQAMGPLIAAGLTGFDPAQGPVIDVGAGTGRGVLAVAAALPDAEIVAVEPSDATTDVVRHP